ncbi:hypothetical protein [Cycloclasticus zancles]|uniref:Uncharacterized protein n=1 Tax=Cycloclasticus zancles 78-ME TaxID=1198232 RepID=S5TWR7_9GAMM|nr:hypothetical protein [Cycloclasticus zancles]AGS39610.1 hypothetical protein CYCME_1281 [Cycloclasticus zancles 78-ME]
MSISKELVSHLYPSYKDVFDKEQIKKIIHVEGDFNDEITTSSGVHLELSKIQIVGKKGKDRKEDFQYDRLLYPGVNTLISDNLRGKSSIFKCIKYALTGRDSLKKDVSKWIDYIYLEFNIGDKRYTSCIDKSARIIKAGLYRGCIEDLVLDDLDEADRVFDASNKDEFERYLEIFFYKQLGISSLKWTQKDSRKDVHKLNEAGTSWATFFKTIYLESKDSHALVYGAQGDLLVQILLGLGLTTAMNRLKIKKDMIQFESTRNVPEVGGVSQLDKDKMLKMLNIKLESENEILSKIYSNSSKNDLDRMIKEKSTLISIIQKLEKEKITNIKNNSINQKSLSKMEVERKSLQDEIIKLEGIVSKIDKKYIKINEHIEIGSFFSNLEIKSCPSCNKSFGVDELHASSDKSCQLCHHDMKASDRQEDVSRMKDKLKALSDEKKKIETQVSLIEKSIESLTNKILDFEKNNTLTDISANDEEIISAISKAEYLEGEIESVRKNISGFKEKTRASEDAVAVLKYKISKAEKLNVEVVSKVNDSTRNEIAVLDNAILYLEKIRSEKNDSVVDKFKGFVIPPKNQGSFK